MMIESLLKQIDTHLSATGLSPYSFGFKAVRNGRLVERLRAGETVTIKTLEKVTEYLKENAPTKENVT